MKPTPATYKLTEVAKRAVKITAIELGLKGYEALERIIAGDVKAQRLSKDAHRKFKNG